MRSVPDIQIDLAFDTTAPKKSTIHTNAKPEALGEILEAWCLDQAGKGKDKSAPNVADIYNIRIGLWLEDDSFGTESDTGNKALTAGIVMDLIAHHLTDVKVLALGENSDD